MVGPIEGFSVIQVNQSPSDAPYDVAYEMVIVVDESIGDSSCLSFSDQANGYCLTSNHWILQM